MSESDKLVEKLLAKVREKRAEIKNIENPVFKTNCTFASSPDINSKRINLHVASQTVLVDVLAVLINAKDHHEKASKMLGLTPKFDFGGYSFDDWLSDITTCIGRSAVAKKKEELKKLESKLNDLISPEQKRQMELEEIAKSLEDGTF